MSSRRGYVNAVTVGILLAAALKFIPTMLTDLEFTSYTLASYFIPAVDSDSAFAAWPAVLSAIIQPFGIIFVLLLYLHGNSPRLATEPEPLPGQDKSFLPIPQLKWLALPPDDQIERVGILIVIIGLFCYNLWLGTNQALLAVEPMFIASMLLIIFGAGLGLAIWGLLPQPRRQWRWLVGASFLLGLAVILGMIGPVGRVVLMISPLLLLLGTASQVYGIGRLLRILQDQIGLKWRTTLMVAISAAAIYFGSQFISHLV